MDPLFKELFEYSHQMNQRFISTIVSNAGTLSEESLKLMNHVVNAQHVWNCRIENKESSAGVWYIHNLSDLERIDKFNFEDSLAIIKKYKADTVIEYLTSKGEVFRNTVKEILFHVINHSTHHRAQIAAEFRSNGIDAISSDFIVYRRQALTV